MALTREDLKTKIKSVGSPKEICELLAKPYFWLNQRLNGFQRTSEMDQKMILKAVEELGQLKGL